jgi:lipopolysaccharide biosynthesis glycosyltransferase
MNKAIVTIVSGDKYEGIWKRTEPFFLRYSEKCDADLIVLKGTDLTLSSPHWIKFSVYDLLKKDFDRIAFIDADIIIRDDTPSLFDIVPEDHFGIFNEGQFTPRNICIYEVMKKYNVQGFQYDGSTYYNTGVMVFSKEHRHIFKVTEQIKELRNSFGEQTFLNMKIMLSGCKIFQLPYRFNRMSIMDRQLGMTRLDCYLIHYAGDGDKLLTKMDRDIGEWAKTSPNYKYKKNVFIWAFGGLGDTVSAEPSVRYMREKIYPDANIYLMSEHASVFEHINDLNLSIDYPKVEIDAVLEVNTHQLPWEEFGKYVPFQFTHCVDWVSMVTMGRMIPDKDKQINLSFKKKHMKEVTDICSYPEELVLVHPGVGWPSKTFPVEYWESIIKNLLMEGFKVGVIGKEMKASQDVQHGVLPINIDGCVDFREKLSTKGLIALISKAKILITNDSAPVHIAGAFDNYIILLPTCKHPDHTMPYRNGLKYYKSKALYKKLLEDDVFFTSEVGIKWIAKEIPKGHTIMEYLPDVEEVIKTVKQFDEQYEESYCSGRRRKDNDISMESYQ